MATELAEIKWRSAYERLRVLDKICASHRHEFTPSHLCGCIAERDNERTNVNHLWSAFISLQMELAKPKKNEFVFDFETVIRATKETALSEICDDIQKQMNSCCRRKNWIEIQTGQYTDNEMEEARNKLKNAAIEANIKTEEVWYGRSLRVFFYKL